MTVTIKDFFEDYNLLINETQISWDDMVLSLVESIINLKLVEQCPESNLSSDPKTFVIQESTKIKKDTLSKILETFDRIVPIWKLRRTFKTLLNKEEWKNFEKLLEIYDDYGLTKTIDEVKKLKILSNTPENSYLKIFIKRLTSWDSVDFILQSELEKKWTYIEENTMLEICDETELFIEKFRCMVIWLINQSKTWYINKKN